MWEYLELIAGLTALVTTGTAIAIAQHIPYNIHKKLKWKQTPTIILDPALSHLRKPVIQAMHILAHNKITYNALEISKPQRTPGCIYITISSPTHSEHKDNSFAYTHVKAIGNNIFMAHIYLKTPELNPADLLKLLLHELIHAEGYTEDSHIKVKSHIWNANFKDMGFNLGGIKR